jgi:DNA replicative helicase MCM subunit Mcm2 (Cdc46/Mcm family)
MDILKGDRRTAMVHQILSRLFAGNVERLSTRQAQIFDSILGYDGIKRTFFRSLNSEEPVHILLVGPPGQAKTLFLKCILETEEKKAFFTVGGNASKSGLVDVLLTCSQNTWL